MNSGVFNWGKQEVRILNIIRNYHEIDKNILKEHSMLSLPTLNKFIDNLKKDKLIINKGKNYCVNKDSFSLVGISIGSAQTKILLLDAEFEIIPFTKIEKFRTLLCKKLLEVIDENDKFFKKCLNDRTPYVYYSTPTNFVNNKMHLDRIFESIKIALEKKEEYGLDIISIGVSSTGLVNRESQKIIESHNAPCIENESIDTLLFEDYKNFFIKEKINIHLEQNSKAAVIAEKTNLYMLDSINKDCKNMACIYLGAGIGCGIISNGQILYGKNGYSGEIGHLTAPNVLTTEEKQAFIFAESDEKCSCGKDNCFDYLIRKYVFGKSKLQFSLMTSNNVVGFLSNPSHILQKNLLVKYLGIITEILTNLLNLEVIVFTGKFCNCENILIRDLYIERDRNPLRFVANDCKFLFSKLGASAPAVGAAIAAYYDKIGQDVNWKE